VSERKQYPSDLSDEQWSLIEPVIAAWKDRHRSVSGHQGAYEMREIVNAILYQGRTGCQWAYIPHDLPPKSATYYYFAAWRDDRTDQVIHELLRCRVRERARRLLRFSACRRVMTVHDPCGMPLVCVIRRVGA
jgi:transposase